ncbi:MAG: glycosyltransferase family 2 protein [Anaerolineae bacterium]
MPQLSICIVNHLTPDLTESCVKSIVDTAGDLAVEVLLVNNTSDDANRIAQLAERMPFVRVWQNEQPLGFAANQNRLMAHATGCYLMPLNSDTIILPGALQELINFMDAHPDVGIAGPRLIYPDGRLQPSCRNFPTPLSHFLEASGLWQLLRGNRWIGWVYPLCSSHTKVMEVDWLTGACLIVRTAAVQQVGTYTEDLFPFYAEDLEWCWRMRKAGWRIMFDPRATVIHLESQSPLPSRTRQLYCGLYRFCATHYSPGRQRAIRWATVLALAPRWLIARSAERRRTYMELIRLPMPCAPIETS